MTVKPTLISLEKRSVFIRTNDISFAIVRNIEISPRLKAPA